MLGLLITGPFATARAQSYGTELPFVLGTSARSSGMGVTSVSMLGDPSIQYYNASAMSSLQWKELVFYKATLFESNSLYHTFSYAQPVLNFGTIGLSVLRVDVGGIEERDPSNQLLSSDLHNAQTRVLLGYARNVGSAFSAGFNIVFDNQSFGSFSGSGVGFDVGFSANQTFSGQSMLRGLREGLVVRNLVEPSVKLDQEKVSDPMEIGFGLGIISMIQNVHMITAIELINPRYSPLTLRVGQEFTYANNYSLRVGVDDVTPTFGGGARFRNVALDYAYRSEDFGDSHRISLSVRLGSSLSEQQARARLAREEEINQTISNRMDEMEGSQITRSMEQGKKMLRDGDYESALGRFEVALLWDPDNKEADSLATFSRYKRAITLAQGSMGESDYAGALIHLKTALRHIPEDGEAQQLINTCNRRIAASRNSAVAIDNLMRKAIDLYAERRFTEASSGFEEVLKIDSGNQLAKEYRKKCRINIRTLMQRLTVDARGLAGNGDYEGAIRLLEQALAYDKDDVGIVVEIARYKKLLKRKSPLVVVQKPVTKPKPKPPTQSTRPSVNRPELEKKYAEGMNAFKKGDFDGSIRALSAVWAQDPDFHNVSSLLAKAYLFVGMNYYSDQNYSEAIQVWERALTVDPNNNKARRYLSKVSEEVRKLGGASDGR